uniref:G-protein coupled receptors family 1 profile domain-containing protein n=1 Tax=Plectus sambesii TaxID=2011161 RepID=A0A914VX20_9BILA
MLIIGGMAAVDTIYGLGAFLFGIYRLAVIADGSYSAKATQWDCLSGSPFFIMNIGMQLSALMNTFISVDRFIAVAFAVRYRALHFYYVIKAFILIGVYGMISCLAMFASSYLSPPIGILNRLCSGPPFPAWYNIFQLSFTAGIGLLSVLIYIGVYVAHGKMLKAAVHERLNDQQAKRQRRLTVTIGVITVSTCVLFVAPSATIVVCYFAGVPAPFGSALGIMSRTSPIVHFGIYIARQRDIRHAMYRLMTCKHNGSTAPIQTTTSRP